MNASVRFLQNILKSLSPIAALEEKGEIVYSNPSFQKEFLGRKKKKSETLFEILKLNSKDKTTLSSNLSDVKSSKQLQGEFAFERKTYGYTISKIDKIRLIFLKDISEKKRLERKIESLYRGMIQLQENERKNISKELHDSVGQTLVAAKLHLEANSFEKGIYLLNKASQELREVYSRIYPSTLRELGLAPSIKQLLKDSFSNQRVEFSHSIQSKWNDSINLEIYRIVQEHVANIIKHSKASRVSIKILEKNNFIQIKIMDNGIGFDLEKTQRTEKGFGLENMKRRTKDLGGSIEISSAPQKGTSTKIEIPLQATKKTHEL